MGYDQLRNMINESRKEAAEEEQKRHGNIAECPSCGFSALKENQHGDKHCPICGWTLGPLSRF
jgi:rubrerythrin